jgi:ribosomal protein S16
MNRRHLTALIAERKMLRGMIDEIPIEDVMDRGSLLAKLETIESQIAAIPTGREPAKARLTFVGRPVVGSYGIFADFGMKAVNGFAEAVAAVAASLTAPLRAMGPIPNREQNQLLITNTALGSFGFELEELPGAQMKLDEPSMVEQAIDKTQALLLATIQPDDEVLADSAAELDQRAIDKVRTFVSTLADNEALCAIQFKDKLFRFESGAQMRRSIERMSEANLHETTEELVGEFEGALPFKRRTFEFRVEGSDDVIVGRFGAGVDRPEEINKHLHEPCTVQVGVTRVGQGRPRYILLGMPTWHAAAAD